MADPFQFDLVSPERLLMSEKVTQVVVPGSEGQFTVLIGHAPVMTTLRPGVVDVTLASGKHDRIFVRGGFADVNAGGLTVLAEQAIPLGDLDPETIAKEIRDAEEDVADAKDETAKANAALKVSQLREVQVELARPGTAGGH
jgi:F-type H+-transporting ATPase subunit epsilon